MIHNNQQVSINKKMKIFQINGHETPGSRFHGLAITPQLREYGVYSKHFSWLKDTNNPNVITINDQINHRMYHLYRKAENFFSLQSVLYPYAYKIMKLPEFKEADLIHLHIIHAGFFSMRHLPELTRRKPVVWTLHDPWALTGHCLHPFDCDRWKIGCGKCPDLKTYFSLRRDHTKFLFSYKERSFRSLDLDIVVASKWMKKPLPCLKKLEFIIFLLALILIFLVQKTPLKLESVLAFQIMQLLSAFELRMAPIKD